MYKNTLILEREDTGIRCIRTGFVLGPLETLMGTLRNVQLTFFYDKKQLRQEKKKEKEGIGVSVVQGDYSFGRFCPIRLLFSLLCCLTRLFDFKMDDDTYFIERKIFMSTII